MTKAATPLILEAENWRDYRLLDSGGGRKLEQVGDYRFIRPEAQALWEPELGAAEWGRADGEFVSSASGRDREEADGGKWKLSPSLPEQWVVRYDGLSFNAMPTPFRHLGFFPEQSAHWDWCAGLVRARVDAGGGAPAVLNLFGYTGVASLHAARAGAEVTHVDSSKKAVAQAFANRDRAGMRDAPRTPAASSSARRGAAGNTTASSWTRRNTAAAPRARSGGWTGTSPDSSATSRRSSPRTPCSWC